MQMLLKVRPGKTAARLIEDAGSRWEKSSKSAFGMRFVKPAKAL